LEDSHSRLSFHSLTTPVLIATASTRVFSSQPPALHELGSVDHGFEDDRIDKVAEPERRAFTYFMLSTIRFAYASATRLALVKFLSNLSPSADVLALAFSEFDLAGMEFGKSMSVMWRGKPIFIRRRTPEEIAEVRSVPMDHLRDQEHDEDRVMNDDYIVVIAICPHLGCVPVADAGDYDAFFCPCHGSHYDISGRIRKGPAPLNLEVPPYKFIGDYTILMG
jgi:ubiquinol-cytochrome c reductase iron-sulfur subunit